MYKMIFDVGGCISGASSFLFQVGWDIVNFVAFSCFSLIKQCLERGSHSSIPGIFCLTSGSCRNLQDGHQWPTYVSGVRQAKTNPRVLVISYETACFGDETSVGIIPKTKVFRITS